MGEMGLNCIDCHKFHDEGSGTGPDLTAWASRDWTIGIIKNPAHQRFYSRRNDRMPAYGERQELTDRQVEMIAEWLRAEVK
jgi:mono/diheme cytochrome c family protein